MNINRCTNFSQDFIINYDDAARKRCVNVNIIIVIKLINNDNDVLLIN